MSQIVKVYEGQYTLRGEKGGAWTNKVRTEKISDSLFLEFGERTQEDGVAPTYPYTYVSLMQGNFKKPDKAKQLYFAHEMNGNWWVFSDDAASFVKKLTTKQSAIDKLRELAKSNS